MRHLFLIFVTFIIAGCTAPTLMVDVPNIEQSSALTLVDERPESEKKSEFFSSLVFSEAYATYRRGDELTDPTALRIFQHRVYEKFASKASIPELKVSHFVVYMNFKSELRRGTTGGVLGGLVGGLIAAGTQKYGVDGLASIITNEEFEAFEEEFKRALYSEEENPDKASVYIVYLAAELDGKPTFIKTITPTRFKGKDESRHPHVVAIETAIAYFLDQY